MARLKARTALEAVGGSLPVGVHELARRAYAYTLDPLANPVKALMDEFSSVEQMPPMLGVFNDIERSRMREDEVLAWAKAGILFVVNDGEHSQQEGRMGRAQNAMIGRAGLTSVQRLPREAVSEHGDALCLGARGTMRPYASTVAEAEQYCRSVAYPPAGAATPDARGGYPMRLGDREVVYSADSLRAAESETQGWLQFETAEYIGVGKDKSVRDAVLDAMAAQGRHRMVGFVGPFDAALRGGCSTDELHGALAALPAVAASRGVVMGRVCGGPNVEATMLAALKAGYRLLVVPQLTSDLPYCGAAAAAAPFFAACEAAGLSAAQGLQ